MMKYEFQSQALVKGNPIWVILKILFYLIAGFMTLILLFAILDRRYENVFLILAVLPLGIALYFRSRAQKHFVISRICLEFKDYEMQWTFPDLDRRYNKNLYIVAYRDITDLKLDAETNCLWITGTIGEAKIDSDKPEKQLKEFGFFIEEEYVTQVTEVLTERSGRIILWYNIPEPDEFYDEEEDPDEEDGDDSEEESDDEK